MKCPFAISLLLLALAVSRASAADQARPFANDQEAREWLVNMAVYHRFTPAEMQSATGLAPDKLQELLARLKIRDTQKINSSEQLLVLPYPGGRHPRIGFLDGAIDPQRETKISIFTPWDPHSYVVADVPEAIWSNLGLTYLAHTHVPTIWTKQNINHPPLEWTRNADGSLRHVRPLPNGITFGTEVTPRKDGVKMRQWLHNGTKEKLTGLRVQNCVMLKAAEGFNAQTDANKVLSAPYAAARSDDGKRWIITAWAPNHRAWQNPPVPCIHSDPIFPDCAPGLTVELRGWLSFYEGTDVQAEFKRLDALGWK